MAMKLRTYLREQGRGSAAALARDMGVSEVNVSRWANGRAKPEGKNLVKLVELTGIPAAELRPDLAAAFAPQAAE